MLLLVPMPADKVSSLVFGFLSGFHLIANPREAGKNFAPLDSRSLSINSKKWVYKRSRNSEKVNSSNQVNMLCFNACFHVF